MSNPIEAVLDGIKALAKFIDPPDDPMHQRRWRVTVSVGCILILIHVLWACGYGHRYGINGFVKLDDMTALIDELKQQNTELKQAIVVIGGKIDAHDLKLAHIENQGLQTNLFQARKAECKAGKNPYIAREMTKLQDEYQQKNNGASWPVPPCENILE